MMIMEFQFMQNIKPLKRIFQKFWFQKMTLQKDMKFLELRDGIILNWSLLEQLLFHVSITFRNDTC
jgi:hypothetical protein